MSFSLIHRVLLGAGLLAASVSQPAAANFSEPTSASAPSVQITGAFTGFLIDQYTGRPVENAVVALMRQENEQLTAGAVTAENGEFRLDRAAFGHYTLHVEVPGYLPLRETITLAAGRNLIDLGTYGLIPVNNKAVATKKLPANAVALATQP